MSIDKPTPDLDPDRGIRFQQNESAISSRCNYRTQQKSWFDEPLNMPWVKAAASAATAAVDVAAAAIYVYSNLYIYNSVSTRRHIHSNSSASTPPNATNVMNCPENQ